MEKETKPPPTPTAPPNNLSPPKLEKKTNAPPTPMAPSPSPSNHLSTPQCPAEHRAWLLIYQMRIGWGKPLVKAFSTQFPDSETHHTLYHASRVRDCDDAVMAQLRELATRCSWYEGPPEKKGDRYYGRAKRLERQEAARERLLSKEFAAGMDGEGGDDGGM